MEGYLTKNATFRMWYRRQKAVKNDAGVVPEVPRYRRGRVTNAEVLELASTCPSGIAMGCWFSPAAKLPTEVSKGDGLGPCEFQQAIWAKQLGRDRFSSLLAPDKQVDTRI